VLVSHHSQTEHQQARLLLHSVLDQRKRRKRARDIEAWKWKYKREFGEY